MTRDVNLNGIRFSMKKIGLTISLMINYKTTLTLSE